MADWVEEKTDRRSFTLYRSGDDLAITAFGDRPADNIIGYKPYDHTVLVPEDDRCRLGRDSLKKLAQRIANQPEHYEAVDIRDLALRDGIVAETVPLTRLIVDPWDHVLYEHADGFVLRVCCGTIGLWFLDVALPATYDIEPSSVRKHAAEIRWYPPRFNDRNLVLLDRLA